MSGDDNENMTLREGPATAPGRFTAGGLLALRVLSAALFIFFTALLIYTCATDGSPFRSSLLTPWMVTTLFDYYISLLPSILLAVYRERRTPFLAALLAVYFCCLGSSALWSYLLFVCLRLRPGDAVTKILN